MDQEPQNPAAEIPSINLTDLVLMLNLIRVSADRGAVKAEEMSAVGAVYEKLFKFLQANGAINTGQPSTTDSTDNQET